MVFKVLLGVQFLILSVAITKISSSLTDDLWKGIASESLEYSPNYGEQSDPYTSDEENYDIIFDEEETPGMCSQILHRRLMQFLRNVRALNSTRRGRQDDEGGDDGDDGDGDAAAAGAPVEVLGLELPAAVPQFFKVVANALVSNESAATIDMGFKALAPILQNQVTGAVSLFANVLQGGSPFAAQGPQPTRPPAAAPIRQWPSNTRRPRPRPSQSPIRPNRPSYSEEEYPEDRVPSEDRRPTGGRPSAEREPSGERLPSGGRLPAGGRLPPGERKPAAGSLPPRKRRTTTTSPEKQSTSKEEDPEADVQSPVRPPSAPSGSSPIIRAPSAGSLNRFYATTHKVEQNTEAISSAGGGSLSNFYLSTPRVQDSGDIYSQSQIGSLQQFYSSTSKPQEFAQVAQIGSLNQFYSTTARAQIQESAQSDIEYPQAPVGGSLNQFYAPKPNPPESPQSEPESQAQIGSLKQFYSTTSKAQDDLETETELQSKGGSLNQMYPTTAKVQETEQAVGQIGSLKQFYAGTSKGQVMAAAEVEVAQESDSGGSLKNFYSTVAPESNEESEIDGESGSGNSLNQFYSTTPNVKVKVIIQPENIANIAGENSSPVKQTGDTGEQNEDQNHVQWGALRRFYSTTTPVPQVRYPDADEGQEKFASALLGSLSQIRRTPSPVSPVGNLQTVISPEDKFASLFKPNPPTTIIVSSSSPPKRRRRTTTTTESLYYDDDTETPAKKT